MKGSIALSLSLACVLGLLGGCNKEKGPSEEPTPSDADSNASGGGEVVVEQPGEEPAGEDGSVNPAADAGELQYEGTVEAVVSDVACELDEDCVPQGCCHPTSCGAPSGRPDCSGTMCTMECRSGTMDCFGGCACGPDKKCVATIWTASAPS